MEIFNKYKAMGFEQDVLLCLYDEVKELIEFTQWVANRHYADGLSKAMIIQKAKEALQNKLV